MTDAVETIVGAALLRRRAGLLSSTTSRGCRRADALRRLRAAGGADAARRVPALYYLAGLDLHRGDLRHQGGRAARRRGSWGWRWSPATPARAPRAIPATTPSWDFGLGAGLLRRRDRRARGRRRYRMDTLRDAASCPPGRGAASRSAPTRAASSATRWAATARWRWRCAIPAATAASRPSRRSSRRRRCPGARKAFAGYLGADRSRLGGATTPARWCARGRFPGPLLVDQGTADKFLDEQLKPELFEAACADAGQRARSCAATPATTTATTSSRPSSRSTSRTTRALGALTNRQSGAARG